MLKRPLIVRALFAAVATFGILLGAAMPAAASTASPDSGFGTQIVGGTPATRTWTVSLQDVDPATGLNRHRCGGTLILPQWVLTAAHCIDPEIVNPGGKARIGSFQWNSGGLLATIGEVFAHPNHTGLPVNDIALVKLTEPVPASFHDKIFPLGKVGDVGSGSIVAGWGTVCDTDLADPACRRDIPTNLQQLKERRLPDRDCSLIEPGLGELFHPSSMFCIVSADGQNRQACFADSGSPIMQLNKVGIWSVVGLVVGDGDDAGPLRPHLCSTNPRGGQGEIFATNIGAHGRWIISTIATN